MSSSESANTGPFGGPGSSGQATSISVDQFAELLAATKNTQRSVDLKLSQYQEEVWQGQEEVAVKALKRSEYERLYSFKKRSNREQATFNSKVDERWRRPRASYLLFRQLPYLPQQFGGSRK